MPLSFSDHYNIDPKVFDATGALDPIFDQDTRLFIDPSLLRIAQTPELTESYPTLLTHFENVMRVIQRIQKEGDALWRNADKMLTFPEIKGLCIGYSGSSIHGSGMGAGLRRRMLTTIWEIVRAGVDDPVIFEIVGTLEDKIGPDRISDMIAKIIIQDLIRYTQRISRELGVPLVMQRISAGLAPQDLPINPLTNSPVILVPREVLNELPVVETYSDIGWVAARNDAIRAEFNAAVGTAFGRVSTSDRKAMMKTTCLQYPHVLREILEAYKAAAPELYDFDHDPAGEVVWYRAAKDISQNVPLTLVLPERPTVDQVAEVVQTICEHFRRLVENNQLCHLLYDRDGKPKHESAAQLLFFGIADAYCRASNLDLSPEADSGRGPVDFKMSQGYNGRVLVELKLTKNTKLEQGYDTQLPTYQAAEGTQKGFFVMIDVGGASEKRIARFLERVAGIQGPAPRIINVNGIQQPSASTT